VLSSEDLPMLCRRPNHLCFSETPSRMGHTHNTAQRGFLYIVPTAAIGANNRANETSGITVRLKIASETTNFIKVLLSEI
jgi:hypothetical protein